MIDSGHAFALAAAPLKKEFAKHGLPQIAEDLTATVEDLELVILGYNNAKARRASAIREYGKAMKEAMRDLQRFEVLVANTLSDSPTAIATWEVARSVSRPVGRKACGNSSSGGCCIESRLIAVWGGRLSGGPSGLRVP